MKQRNSSQNNKPAPKSFHCSLGDPRSWTDVVTNTMSLSSVRLEEDLHAILNWGMTPPHLLPGFIHEATHHWCFLSPVGFILSYLQLRARRNGVLLFNGQGDADTLHQLVGDVVRYETALSLLRPLAEGLALFAEFDAISGPASSVFSVPTEMVGWLFSGGLEGINFGGIHLPYEGTRRPLVEWRYTNHCLRRKEAMFGHPFEVENGGYLPGYLAVRQLWFQMSLRDTRLFNETDLFLMFARSFFYDDYELVALLLDESPVEFDTMASIGTHIAGRLDQLGKVTAAQVKRFEQAVTAKEPKKEEIEWLYDTVVADRDLADRGCKLSRELIKKLETPDLDSVQGLLTLWDTQILQQRDIMNFGHLDIQIDIDEGGQYKLIVNDRTIHTGSCLPGVEAGSASGSLNLLCSMLTNTRVRAASIYRGSELIAIFFAGPDERNEHHRERFMQLSIPTSLQSGTDEMKVYMDSVLAWEGVADIIEEMRNVLPDLSETVYAVKALPNMSKERRESVVTAMKEDGLLPILNWDRTLVNGVALLSLSWSQRLRKAQIEEFLNSHGIGLEPTLAAIETSSKEYGIPEIWDGGDMVLCSV